MSFRTSRIVAFAFLAFAVSIAPRVARAQSDDDQEPSIFDTPTPTPAPTPVPPPSGPPGAGDPVVAERVDGTTVAGCLVSADDSRVVIATTDAMREIGIPRANLRELRRNAGGAPCESPRRPPHWTRLPAGLLESLGGRPEPGWAADIDVLVGASGSQVRGGADDTIDELVPLHGRASGIAATARDVGWLPIEVGALWTQRTLTAARTSMSMREVGGLAGGAAQTARLHAFLGVELCTVHTSFDEPSGRTTRSRFATGLFGDAHVFVWRGLALGAAVHATLFPAAAGHDMMYATDESFSVGWRF